jgi:hypothetical protein
MKDDPSGTILSRCKERAKKKGIEVNLTKEDIIVPSVCPVLGIPLFLGDDIACDNSYSLDRIDNTKGYVKGNVRVISNRANNIKNVGNAEEHRKVAEYIDKNLPIDNGDYSI